MNKELNRFAYSLCSIYSKDGELDINDISEFDLNELSSLLIKNDKYLASEATGPDNIYWEKYMLPALTKYLSNSHDAQQEKDYLRVWSKCITSYFMPMIQELLGAQMVEYNFEQKTYKHYQLEERA